MRKESLLLLTKKISTLLTLFQLLGPKKFSVCHRKVEEIDFLFLIRVGVEIASCDLARQDIRFFIAHFLDWQESRDHTKYSVMNKIIQPSALNCSVSHFFFHKEVHQPDFSEKSQDWNHASTHLE